MLSSIQKRAAAYDAIARIVIDYMPPDSGMTVQDVFEEVLRIVDRTSAPERLSADQMDLPLSLAA